MGLVILRQTEIHTAEPLLHDPSTFEAEMALEKLKIHTSLGSEQIPAELINAEGRTMHCEIHKLSSSFWGKEELSEWKESVRLSFYKKVE
jgi:hypothetical protein